MTPEKRARWIEEVVPPTKPFAPEFLDVLASMLHADRRAAIEEAGATIGSIPRRELHRPTDVAFNIGLAVAEDALRPLAKKGKDAPADSAASPNPDARPEDHLDPDWLADVLGHTPMSDGTRLSDKLDRVSLVNVALEITEGGALGGGRLYSRDKSKTPTEERKS